MEYSNMKEKLISIVQDGEAELLKLMYDVAEGYQHRQELRKRGLIKLTTWGEAKAQIIGNRKAFGK